MVINTEILHVERGSGEEPVEKMCPATFKDWPELRKVCLPNLEEICFEYVEDDDVVEEEGHRELRSRCKEAGIKVKSIGWVKGREYTAGRFNIVNG
ncbi:hypothetical protein HO173_009351 [Letharia columbiana]|uniref:Uncharacterized protein n=1 Tax=Letharia columbiana TaxID=112416 RepID=A0A8H6FPS0_9LECA|nr:uncharacterized protein HO173_009351 [Letharia columbiana]KAF6232471.1 hypothetical protein HO173_009351 [Letharia columbiana]